MQLFFTAGNVIRICFVFHIKIKKVTAIKSIQWTHNNNILLFIIAYLIAQLKDQKKFNLISIVLKKIIYVCFRKLLMFSSLVCPSSEFFAANQNLSVDKKQMESFYSFLKEVSLFTKDPMGFNVPKMFSAILQFV